MTRRQESKYRGVEDPGSSYLTLTARLGIDSAMERGVSTWSRLFARVISTRQGPGVILDDGTRNEKKGKKAIQQ